MPNVNINNMSLYYRAYPPRIDPDRLTVMFIHGSGCSSHRWSRQFPSEDGAVPLGSTQLVAFDLPGHANSTGSGCQTVADYTSVTMDFVATLGLRQVILAGNSLGGSICLQAALDPPAWLNGLVLVGTGARLRVLPQILAELAADTLPSALVEGCYAATTPLALIADAERDAVRTSNPVRLGDLLACDQFDMRDRLDEITSPCLIVVGADDRLTPPKYAVYLKDHLPNAELVQIPDAGHMVMFEQPAAFNRALSQFLTRVSCS